jgi:hypothetical protein
MNLFISFVECSVACKMVNDRCKGGFTTNRKLTWVNALLHGDSTMKQINAMLLPRGHGAPVAKMAEKGT